MKKQWIGLLVIFVLIKLARWAKIDKPPLWVLSVSKFSVGSALFFMWKAHWGRGDRKSDDHHTDCYLVAGTAS